MMITLRSQIMYSIGPLIRNTYFEQGLNLLPPRMPAQFLISPFLIASQEYCTYFLSPPFLVSSAVISSYLFTAVIAFFFSILWPLPFSRRIFVASTTPPPVSPRLCDIHLFRSTRYGTTDSRISQLYRYVCTVRTDRRPFLVPKSNPIYILFLITGSTMILIDFLLLRFLSFFF